MTENDDKIQNLINDFEFENNFASIISSILEFEDNFAFFSKSIRAKRLLMRYQNVADIIVFLQDDLFNLTFVESRRKEINDLLKKRVFELTTIDKISENVRIFNFRVVDEIKHSEISQTYENSRLVIQVYNDQEKTLILTQILIIQRMSQQIILVLVSSINDCHFYLRA